MRQKLRLASTRNGTVEEDTAYSLIGIFSSDIAPRYGLRETALGQLLENTVARSGDVTIIAWTGKSLPYKSALPDSLAVYNQIPYSPPPIYCPILQHRIHREESSEPQNSLSAVRRVTTVNQMVAETNYQVTTSEAAYECSCDAEVCIPLPSHPTHSCNTIDRIVERERSLTHVISAEGTPLLASTPLERTLFVFAFATHAATISTADPSTSAAIPPASRFYIRSNNNQSPTVREKIRRRCCTIRRRCGMIL